MAAAVTSKNPDIIARAVSGIPQVKRESILSKSEKNTIEPHMQSIDFEAEAIDNGTDDRKPPCAAFAAASRGLPEPLVLRNPRVSMIPVINAAESCDR